MLGMERLSGWQRLAIVLSVLWFLGVFLGLSIYQHSRNWDYASFSYRMCLTREMRSGEEKGCEEKFRKDVERSSVEWLPIFLLAALPIPVLWLLGWLVFEIVKWITRGFK